ncbi:MAG: response regulator [Thermodesulfobacteriota bacterium]|nr:response regulator [Thermodesulfobacteriota bacterium]
MSEKVIFVDDEKHILKSLERLFMDEPYEISTMNSPFEALEMMEKNEVAVVVSDQRMPEMEGTAFLGKVRKKWPNTVRMMLTGYADLEAAMAAINQGNVYRFISKPWDETELKLAVKNAFVHYNLLSENKRLFKLTKSQNEELQKLNKGLEIKVEERTREIKGLLEELEKSFYKSIRVFMSLMELFNPSLGSHAKRVSVVSMEIAKQFGMDKKYIELIEISALLHDIGLIGLPRTIFEKSEKELTKHEIALIKQHPELGHATLIAIDRLKDASVLVLSHHENFDGKGYPKGLKNEEIHLGARIIRAADDFDNLINKNGMTRNSALDRLKARSGYEYDPQVVFKLIDSLDSFKQETEKERVIQLSDLQPGMIIARPIKTNSGRLLLAQDAEIQNIHIEKLAKFHQVDPIVDRIYVYKQG